MSNHLTNIIEKHNRITTLLTVFVDIEKYSKRRTVNQISVVDSLTECLKKALSEVSKKYIQYAQKNNLNFDIDIIKIPTGDGAAIVFPFEGLHDIHLEFSKILLNVINTMNTTNQCNKFNSQGWCNCHSNFNLSIGISEGKGVIYKDLNNNYNVAGAVVNMAARVMSKGDRNQIMLTEEAYIQLIEMDNDSNLVDNFFSYESTLKHDLKIKLYQYKNIDLPFLNSEPSEELSFLKRTKEVMSVMSNAGFPMLNTDILKDINKDELMSNFENFAKLVTNTKTPQVQNKKIEG